MSKAKEKFLMSNTLSCLVNLCVGFITTIELRNEAFVTGKVIQVDGFMNVVLEKVKFTDPCGNRRAFDTFFVQERLIRSVQIPSHIDLKESIKHLFKPRATTSQIVLSRHRQHILKKRAERQLEDAQKAAQN